jgi:hypothetical protein
MDDDLFVGENSLFFSSFLFGFLIGEFDEAAGTTSLLEWDELLPLVDVGPIVGVIRSKWCCIVPDSTFEQNKQNCKYAI